MKNKNLVFTNSKQFISSDLEKVDENISINDFKYLLKEFNPEPLKLIKQKRVYLHVYIDSSETFSEDKLPNKNTFIGH